MKTTKYFTTLSIFAFMVIAMQVNSFAADQDVVNHKALVHYFENEAKEMQAKIEEQKEALKHKPHSSFFGKHGQYIEEHVAYKISKYEKIAKKSLNKAAYHKKMAAEQSE